MAKAMFQTVSLMSVALAGCIGINPEWDESPSESAGSSSAGWSSAGSSSAESSSSAAADGASSGSAGGGSSESSTSTTGNADGQSATTAEPPACEDPGRVACDIDGEWSCVDPSQDDEHCGGCFHDCAIHGDASCEEGACICEGSRELCAEQCTDVRNDPSACGEDCVDCRALFGDSADCKHGECRPDD